MLKSIKARLVISHISIVIILATILGTSSFYLMKNYLKTAQEDTLIFTAEHGASMINGFLAGKAKALEDIAKGKEVEFYVTRYYETLMRKYLIEFRETFPILSYFNEQGLEEFKMIDGKISNVYSDISSTDIYRKIMEEPNKIYIQPARRNVEGKPIITFGILRRNFFDEFMGIIIGSVYLEEVMHMANKLTINESMYISIIDSNGRIIAHPNREMVLDNITGNNIAEGLIKEAIDFKKGFGRAVISGVDSFVSYSPVKDIGWSLMVILPYESFAAAPNTLRNISIGLTVVVLLLGVFISLRLGKGIANPILYLANVADLVSKLNLTERARIKSRDEIGSLAASFNTMTDELQNAIATRDLELSERKKAQDDLRKLSLGVEQSPASVVITNVDGKIEYVNAKFTKITGYKSAEVIGKKPNILKSGEQSADFYRNLWVTISLGMEWRGEFRNRKKNGDLFWEYASISPVKNSKGVITHFIAIKEDITFRKRAEEALERQAYYDQLTGLANRLTFLKRLSRENERAKRNKNYLFAVLFMDLDRFKIINDSQGHTIGDELLISAARRLEILIRPGDMISRFGGDEFAILINDIQDVSDATHAAERILDELKLPFNLNGHEVFISGSIGIAMSSTGYEKEEDILRDADAAMYRAKSFGKARYEIFDLDMHASAMKLLQLEADLRRAVELNEFIVYYQPIVSLDDNRITGVEALIRWEHPKRGLISPMEFIPLAEETGLISKIGEWALRTACAQNKAWQTAGYMPLVMKVNFSSRQFHQENLPETVKEILIDTGLSTKYLDIEITESIAMEDQSVEMLNKLSEMGVQTSIDDFGTGYSSLGSLKRFPINTIKIDRSFIRDITVDPNDEAIVKAIIAMAHSLNIEIVAEGVETLEQRSFLKTQNCDAVQGYLYSRPVPGNDFVKLLQKNNVINIAHKLA